MNVSALDLWHTSLDESSSGLAAGMHGSEPFEDTVGETHSLVGPGG